MKRAYRIDSLLNSSNITFADRKKNVARLEAGTLRRATYNRPDDANPEFIV